MSFSSLNNKPEDIVKAWKETRKLSKKLKEKEDLKEHTENRRTLECSICGSLLIGDEPRIVTICNDCKDARPAPLPPMSPFEARHDKGYSKK